MPGRDASLSSDHVRKAAVNAPRHKKRGVYAVYDPDLRIPWRSRLLSRQFFIVAALALVSLPLAVSAEGLPYGAPLPTGIVPVPNAPVLVQKCQLARGDQVNNYWSGSLVVGNRTKHVLASTRLVLVAYDVENTRIDQQSLQYQLNQPLASADTTFLPLGVSFRGSPALISRVSCRIDAASFSANKAWQYGQQWKERILPLTAEQAQVGGEGSTRPPTVKPAISVSKPTITVTNAWNDVVNGVTFVHAALSVNTSESPATLRPADLLDAFAPAIRTKIVRIKIACKVPVITFDVGAQRALVIVSKRT